MINIADLLRAQTAYSPGGLRCIIHENPCNIYDNVIYQVEGDVWTDDKYPEDNERFRTMDAYTFCEWFSLEKPDE